METVIRDPGGNLGVQAALHENGPRVQFSYENVLRAGCEPGQEKERGKRNETARDIHIETVRLHIVENVLNYVRGFGREQRRNTADTRHKPRFVLVENVLKSDGTGGERDRSRLGSAASDAAQRRRCALPDFTG